MDRVGFVAIMAVVVALCVFLLREPGLAVLGAIVTVVTWGLDRLLDRLLAVVRRRA